MSDQCPICDNEASASLDRPLQMPILMNRIYRTAEAGRAAARGPLEFMACPRCGFVWNRAFDADLIVYDEEYENDQAYSPAFRAHMTDRARDVVQSVSPDERISYLEVGCGQGRFVAEVAAVAGDRLLSAEGFDPAWRGRDGDGPGGTQIHRVYFSRETASRLRFAPNVVATRHTIEHVKDPLEFLVAIRSALGPKSNARLWVETPCIDWILRKRAMQDFFYEHCSLFSARSLAYAMVRAGFAEPRVRHVFGGQYLWADAVAGRESGSFPLGENTAVVALDKVRDGFIAYWQERVKAAAERGPVALWGAGAKGVSFAILSDPDSGLIDHVVDVNPQKQGYFLPGSGLPVVSPEESAKRNPATIFVMNENYVKEISAKAREVGLNARLVPVDDGDGDEN